MRVDSVLRTEYRCVYLQIHRDSPLWVAVESDVSSDPPIHDNRVQSYLTLSPLAGPPGSTRWIKWINWMNEQVIAGWFSHATSQRTAWLAQRLVNGECRNRGLVG